MNREWLVPGDRVSFRGDEGVQERGVVMAVLGCMQNCFSRAQLFVTSWSLPARLLCPWDSPGKNTGVGCH